MAEKKFSLFASFTKFLFHFFVGIFLLFVFLTFVLPHFVPLEKVVPMEKVNEVLGSQAGLKIELNGKTRVSILPFIGFSAKNIAIKSVNEEFAKNENVITAEKIDVKLSVFPLIFGNVVVKNILLKGANINILKCNGKINVFAPNVLSGGNALKQTNLQTEKQAGESENISSYIQTFGMKNFEIIKSNFLYEECETQVKYSINGFDAIVKAPSFEQDVLVTFGMAVNGVKVLANVESSNIRDILEKKIGKIKAEIKGDFGNLKVVASYNFDEKFETFFNKTNFEITADGLQLQQLAQMANVSAENLKHLPSLSLAVNGGVEQTEALLKNVSLKMGTVQILGNEIAVYVPQRTKPESIHGKGNLVFEMKNIAKILEPLKLNLEIVKKYPSQVNGNFVFSYLKNVFKLEETSSIKIDDTVINVSLIANVVKNVKLIAFSVSSKLVNLDDYLNLKSEGKPAEGGIKKDDVKKNQKHVSIAQQLSKQPIVMPQIKNMVVDGSVSLQKIVAGGLEIGNFSSKLKVRNGLIENSLALNVFDGSIKLNIGASEKNGFLSALNLNALIGNLEIQRITDLLTIKKVAEGRVSGNVQFNSNANNMHDIVMNGAGNVNFNANKFTVIGLDLDSLIQDVRSDYKSVLGVNAVDKYVSPNKKTSVDSIDVKTSIAKGVVENKILALRGRISIEGNGTVNLQNENINYTILPKDGQNPLPAIVVKRTIEDPFYTIDPTLYVKSQVANVIERKVRDNPEVQEKLLKINNVINNFRL